MTQAHLSRTWKQTHGHGTDLGLPVGAGAGRTVVWDEQRKTPVEWTDKALLRSTGSRTQYPVMNHNGKEDEKEGIYTCNHFSV